MNAYSSCLRICVLVIVWATWCSAKQLGKRIIETKFGQLRGQQIDIPNRYLSPVEAYFGLQYASVLGKELRFLPPTGPMEEWSGIRVAVKHRPVCPQKIPDLEALSKIYPHGRIEHVRRIIPFIQDQAEECLNLNIFTPLRGKNHLSVMDSFFSPIFIVHFHLIPI